MDPLTMIALAKAAVSITSGIAKTAQIAFEKGDINQQQLDEIRGAAELSDQRWDDSVRAARDRLRGQ